MKPKILIFQTAVLLLLMSPGVIVAQGCNVDTFEFLGNSDVLYMRQYLYLGGPAPPDYDIADLDDHQIITTNDYRILVRYVNVSGPEPTCPPTQGPIPSAPNPNNWLQLQEAVFPAGQQSLALHYRITTDREIVCMNLPLSIRVGGYDPQIINVTIAEPFSSWGGLLGEWASRGDGKVIIILGDITPIIQPLEPQDHELFAEIEISLPEAPSTPLSITSEWDNDIPPVGPYGPSHYPFLLPPDGKQGDTAWIPDLLVAANCCDVPGDANDNDIVNILDITYLIDILYGDPQGPAPPCMYEGDANGNCLINILDITYLIDFLYGDPQGPTPVCATSCPGW